MLAIRAARESFEMFPGSVDAPGVHCVSNLPEATLSCVHLLSCVGFVALLFAGSAGSQTTQAVAAAAAAGEAASRTTQTVVALLFAARKGHHAGAV